MSVVPSILQALSPDVMGSSVPVIVSHLRGLNRQLHCCEHLHSKLCLLCYIGQ